MSGHSKWSTIKHKKGAQDAKRGKLFSKLIKEITVSARLGGGDPDTNPRLRTAVNKAARENMPKDNIERAIKKGTGELEGYSYTEMVYEGYAPGGVAIMVQCLTDNKNRTAADIRSIFTKGGGNLGENGCVSYLFTKKGIISYSAEQYSEEQIMEKAIDVGAEDVQSGDDYIDVETSPEDFDTVLSNMQEADYSHETAEVAMIPEAYVSLDSESTQKVLKLLETLDDHEDVQNVWSNIEIPDDFDINV